MIIRRIIAVFAILLSLNVLIIGNLAKWPIPLTLVVFILAIAMFFIVAVRPISKKEPTEKTQKMALGNERIWLATVTSFINLAWFITAGVLWVPDKLPIHIYIIAIVLAALGELLLFIMGMVPIYLCSKQLGLKWRFAYILTWWVPVVGGIVLLKVYSVVKKEYTFEATKANLNKGRMSEQVCKTKYPILFIHGVFFRDTAYFNYWGRIPQELEANGAKVYYGNHQSAGSIEESGAEIAARIKEIAEETGCEKVNIIAHSKGGLDSRYAISQLDCVPYVASLTTINTPHYGCVFTEELLKKMSPSTIEGIANKYNAVLRKLGDKSPDFIASVRDLTVSRCAELNKNAANNPNIYYQSVGSKLNKATSGKFPLNISYQLVKGYDGPNDGLVAVDSAKWGDKFTYVTVTGNRGISHGDMIDLNRENFEGFDVREFYVDLVKGLKEKNL